MPLAFRVGPMPTPTGSESLYVAIRSSGQPVAVQAGDDDRGLRELIEALPEEPLEVEPALAKAGKRLGLRRARLPAEVAHIKATMTLAIAIGDAFDDDVRPERVGDLLDASVGFMRARPWRWIDGDTPLRVEVDSDGQQEVYQGSLMGQAGQELGFMIAMEPGALERLLMAEDEDELEALSETMDMLSVSMEREPTWAVKTITAVLGTRRLPMPMRVAQQEPQRVTAHELAMLSAVLRAASELRPGGPPARGKSTTEPPVEVTLHLPEPDAATTSPSRRETTKVGRNAPCPCGSGRKYKRCCLAADAEEARRRNAEPATTPAHALEVSLVREILEHADAEHPGWCDDLPPPWRDLGAQPNGVQLLMPLLAFQREVEPGRSALRAYMEREGDALPPAARELLTAQTNAVLSVWEVLDVRVGEGIELVDLLTGERRYVDELSGSRGVGFRDALLARVIEAGSRFVLSGVHPQRLTPEGAHEVVTEIRRRLGLKVKPVPPERLAAPEVVDALLERWQAALAVTREDATIEQELRNTDGEPLATHEDRYAIDGGRWREVAEAILGLPGTYLDDQTRKKVEITFTKPGNAMHPHWRCTVVGSAVADARWLKVEANSQARIDALRQTLERTLGPRIVHRERKASPPRVVRAGKTGPIAVDATRTGRLWTQPQQLMLREQARHFVETPLEALGGRTPRRAMGTARDRRVLHQLLKNNEHRMAPGDATDFGLLVREQLGLSLTGEVIVQSADERRLGSGRKVSETLLDFAAPLLLELDDDALVRPVLELAAMVWNMDVVEREGGLGGMSRRLLGRAGRGGPWADAHQPMEELRQRRRRFFGEDRRLIEVRDVRWRDGEIYVEAAARLASPGARRSLPRATVPSKKRGPTAKAGKGPEPGASKESKEPREAKPAQTKSGRKEEPDERSPQQLDLLK